MQAVFVCAIPTFPFYLNIAIIFTFLTFWLLYFFTLFVYADLASCAPPTLKQFLSVIRITTLWTVGVGDSTHDWH